MGFLEVGRPIPWEALSLDVMKKVKRDGLLQLLHVWLLNRTREDTNLYWGDEQEMTMVYLDAERREAKLIVEAPEVLTELRRREATGEWDRSLMCCKQLFLVREKKTFLRSAEWHPEFGNHMIEATPSPPYALSVEGVTDVEESMMSRRLKIQSVLQSLYGNKAFVMSMPAFPLLGVTSSHLDVTSPVEAVDLTHLGGSDALRIADYIWNPGNRHNLADFLEGSVGIPKCLPNPHPRFPTLVHNVNTRRGTKVSSLIKAFEDAYTFETPRCTSGSCSTACSLGSGKLGSSSFGSENSPEFNTPVRSCSKVVSSEASTPATGTSTVRTSRKERVEGSVWELSKDLEEFGSRADISDLSRHTRLPVKGFIYQDCFAYGMSQCCLQATFGCPNVSMARHLYDQMVVFAPIFLAISAGTPALSGLVSDLDCRWRVLEQTCDCRTDAELSTLKQSRYGCAPMFIADHSFLDEHDSLFNDQLLEHNEEAYDTLSRFMDQRLALHFATLWTRDPLVIFEDKIDIDNTTRTDHFENIQSTNWNTVRFKPPPPSPDGSTLPYIGWRVELRTPESQLTDFENAAIACISSLIALAIIRSGLPRPADENLSEENAAGDSLREDSWMFYMPISQVRENMMTAHKRHACTSEKFWFPCPADPLVTKQWTLRTIMLDRECGILSKLDRFVSKEWRAQRCSNQAVDTYRLYSNFVRQRVLGQVPTNAVDLRAKLTSHEDYQSDSVVTHSMNYDVCKHAVLTGFNVQTNAQQPALGHIYASSSRTCPQSIPICSASPVIKQLATLGTAVLPERVYFLEDKPNTTDTHLDATSQPEEPLIQSCL
ncbi:glutamate-cysteine ligase, catalytic subunit [Gregarina niphandrodes]|uniref:Glutamate--cysteine ligase n=1 Tax=Gregarina niphandrodes TaxID=110365 RepID=A0A023B1Q0_GRENI|nr:glutamate-cysteine ligase, catalytic subunit [Gregarina niphandrodes]EZG48821.1 glutamate-cysteine ligase, catalytic subunit [Gregarina niphandrodes]|eukprot:XP_011132073.1 glutamate-cysteine ligase, catalytic subunit [Gregarina niphandrodes]